MMSTTTKSDSPQPATEMAAGLFDNWFDPIETAVRGRVRTFIEETIRSEFDEALARPRYGRSRGDNCEAGTSVAGHRHGRRKRTLTGTFGPVEIEVPRARLQTADGGTTEVAQLGAAGLSAAHACRRRADCRLLPGWHQHAPGSPGCLCRKPYPGVLS